VSGGADQGGTGDSRLVTFLKNAAIIVGALGVLAYAVLRTAYVPYYPEFRVTCNQPPQRTQTWASRSPHTGLYW
jgi:hypothetical protein